MAPLRLPQALEERRFRFSVQPPGSNGSGFRFLVGSKSALGGKVGLGFVAERANCKG